LGHPLNPTAATVDPRADFTISYEWLSNATGFTICYKGRGISFSRVGISEIVRLDTEAHETKHQEQYTRYPTCEAYDAYYRTVKGRVYSEAEAYATGLCVQVRRGMNREFLEREFADRISYWYTGGQVSMLTIMPIIRQFEKC
jgi:hypothetical protein